MASFFGTLQRPLSAGLVAAVAALTAELPTLKLTEPNADPPEMHRPAPSSLRGDDGGCNLSRRRFDVPGSVFLPSSPGPVASPAVLLGLYQYAKLAKPKGHFSEFAAQSNLQQEEVMYRWHLPRLGGTDVKSGEPACTEEKSRMVVVLLGWLGAKQKHLKKYAEWYTSRGFHVVTFTFPMSDVLSYKVGGQAEKRIDSLAEHLAEWIEEDGKRLVFHTFSNTGWLTYGALLERFRNQDPSLLQKIKGCVIDSAPVAAPDPQVWASGFSAAFFKKQSIAAKGAAMSNDPGISKMLPSKSGAEPEPAIAETALLVVLEKFFEVVLNLPNINRRLSDVLDLLSSEQPKCPQLYIYSSADRVIPAKSVESFIERQRRAGHAVRACDFVSSPHVDHLRCHPALYASQLSAFLDDLVLDCHRGCSSS